MHKHIRLIPVAAAAFFIAQANAQHNSGAYTSLNFGQSYAYDIYQDGKKQSGMSNLGASLFLGTFVTPYASPEVGISYWALGAMGKVGILQLAGRLTTPVTEKFSLFGKLGIGLGELRTCVQTCETTESMVPVFGAGFGINFTRQWMGTTEFNGAYFPNSTGNAKGPIGGLTIGVTRLWSM